MSSKIGNVVSGLIRRRMYAKAVNVQASSASAGAAAATAKTDVAAAAEDAARAADKFWMRDPKTGCWVPEKADNRFEFEEVDVVDLRTRMIRHK